MSLAPGFKLAEWSQIRAASITLLLRTLRLMNTHSGGSCWLLQMSLGTLEGASGSQDAVEVSRSVRNYNVISGLQDSRLCQEKCG
jgi:hypothetical protein